MLSNMKDIWSINKYSKRKSIFSPSQHCQHTKSNPLDMGSFQELKDIQNLLLSFQEEREREGAIPTRISEKPFLY